MDELLVNIIVVILRTDEYIWNRLCDQTGQKILKLFICHASNQETIPLALQIFYSDNIVRLTIVVDISSQPFLT